MAELRYHLSLSSCRSWWMLKTQLSFRALRDPRAQRDNPKEKTENIPPKKRRYRCGKEAFDPVLMYEESISCKCETRTTSERHDNKKILATAEREKTTSTMVNDRQRLRMMTMGNQESTSYWHYLRSWTLRWRWSHVHALDPSRETDVPVSHTTTTKTNKYHDKACKSTQKRVDDDRQHRQTTANNQQSTINLD